MSESEFRPEQIRFAVTREREEIALQKGSVNRDLAAISLSTIRRCAGKILSEEVKAFAAYCLLLTNLWRRRVGIEPT